MLVIWSVGRLLIVWSADRFVDYFGYLVGWSVCWLFWLFGQLIGLLIVWLFGKMIILLIDCLIDDILCAWVLAMWKPKQDLEKRKKKGREGSFSASSTTMRNKPSPTSVVKRKCPKNMLQRNRYSEGRYVSWQSKSRHSWWLFHIKSYLLFVFDMLFWGILRNNNLQDTLNISFL